MLVKEAAELLGLAPVTVRMQIDRKSLRATKRGRDWWILPREVERYRRDSLGQQHGGRPRQDATRGKRAPRAKLQVPQD